jgi:LacI family transcriptional regulator
MLGRHDEAERYDCVAGDDAAGVTAAMNHLYELGHRRIAHLTLLEAAAGDRSAHGLRLRRYQESMTEFGLEPNVHVLRSDEGQDRAHEALRDALAAGLDATAVFAAHDELAIGALRAIEETGVDLSVVGYDDVPIASLPVLGLTTVHQPGEAMGAQAIKLLLERIAGRTDPVNSIFEPELYVRTSTRRPADRRYDGVR